MNGSATCAHIRIYVDSTDVMRRLASFSATGTVKLSQTAPEAAALQHLRLAGTRGWLRLGEQRLSAEYWRGAIACARAGLEELGDNYAPPRIVDDTSLGGSASAGRQSQPTGRCDPDAVLLGNPNGLVHQAPRR